MKNVIIVPKDRCPLEVLAEMGERTRNAWIFLHKNVFERLRRSCDEENWTEFECYTHFFWKTTIEQELISVSLFTEPWYSVGYIKSPNIAFDVRTAEPEETLFLKMEE